MTAEQQSTDLDRLIITLEQAYENGALTAKDISDILETHVAYTNYFSPIATE